MGFPAAVPAFLLIGAPGPEWTAFGAVGPEVQVRPRGTATSATIQTSATNCHPTRNRHNGCITTGKVTRTDPFPQIAAGAGQPRGPAGRSTETRRPFHPFGAAITRCFTASPAPFTPTHHRQVVSTMHGGAESGGWSVQVAAGRGAGQTVGGEPFTGAVRGQHEDGRQSRHRAAPHPCVCSSSAGGGARRAISGAPRPLDDRDSADLPGASTADACSAGECRGHLLPLTSPPEGDQDARRGQRPSTRQDPKQRSHTGGAGGVDGEVRPDADLGAARRAPGADPRCADRR